MKPETKRAFRFAPGALLAVCAATALFVFRRPPEDVLAGGSPLSEQLLALTCVAGNEAPIPGESEETGAPKAKAMVARMTAAQKAIFEAGTNALPLLEKWMRKEVPRWRMKTGEWLWKHGLKSSTFPPLHPKIIAFRALNALGSAGLPLTSVVAMECTNSNVQIAAEALSTLSSQFRNIAPFPPSLVNENGVIADEAGYRARVRVLRELRVPAESILNLNGKPIEEEARRLRVLSRRNESFGAALPVLLAHLESSDPAMVENAALCLHNYGPKSIPLLPLLREAETHPSERVRLAAKKAVGRVRAFAEEGRK